MAQENLVPTHVSIREDGASRVGGEAFAHVIVSFCRVGRDGGPDRCHWAAEEYEKISIACQVDSRATRDRLSYSWQAGFSDGSREHPVGVAMVERAAKALRKMQRAADKASATYGEPTTFGQYVARQIAGLKLQGIIVMGTHGYHEAAMDGLVSRIDATVYSLAEQPGERNGLV